MQSIIINEANTFSVKFMAEQLLEDIQRYVEVNKEAHSFAAAQYYQGQIGLIYGMHLISSEDFQTLSKLIESTF